MRTVIIFDHPYGTQASENEIHHRSFSAAVYKNIKTTLQQNGGEVDVIDLIADNFNPVMSQKDLLAWRTQSCVDSISYSYFQRILLADKIVFIFPIWWECMPASTKGFLDKVLAKGLIKSGELKKLQLKNPSVYLITISGTPTFIYRFWYGNPIVKIFKKGTFGKIGLKKFYWFNCNAEEKSLKNRRKLLNRIAKKFE